MTNHPAIDGEAYLSEDTVDPGLYQIVDAEGNYAAEDVPDLDPSEFRDLYRWMVLQRTFDGRAIKLQRRGRLGTYASGRGQEASIIGAAYALTDEDWILPYGREAGALLMHGLSIRDLLLYWRGVGSAARMEGANVPSVSISIGSQMPMATGIGWGLKLDGAEAIALANLGDGATSTGAFHEGVNLGGVIGAQTVYLSQNNQYAISLPFEKQTAARTVAQKAVGYGIDGIRIDGNDVLAVYDAVTWARNRAREGDPVLVEAVTYRRAAHTTSDDPSRYRDEAEVEKWKERDPLNRFEAFLQDEGYWESIDPEAIREEVNEEIDEAIAAADEFEPADVAECFEHVHDEMPPSLERQLENLRRIVSEYPEMDQYVERRPKG